MRVLFLLQIGGEYVGKEMVVAKPVARAIQRYDKEVASLQAIQQRGAVALAGYGIAERAAQAVENRGLEQKRAHAFRLPLQNFFNQIVHDVPVVAGKSSDEVGNVLAPAHGKRRQLQSCNPAFGARLQDGYLLQREIQVHDLIEKASGFGGGEAQIGGAHFGHLAARAQSGER